MGNSGGDVVKVTVTAVDALRNAGHSRDDFRWTTTRLSARRAKTTDATGRWTADVLIGADKSNRLITVTAKSDTLVRTAIFSVNGANYPKVVFAGAPIAGSRGTIEYLVSGGR